MNARSQHTKIIVVERGIRWPDTTYHTSKTIKRESNSRGLLFGLNVWYLTRLYMKKAATITKSLKKDPQNNNSHETHTHTRTHALAGHSEPTTSHTHTSCPITLNANGQRENEKIKAIQPEILPIRFWYVQYSNRYRCRCCGRHRLSEH